MRARWLAVAVVAAGLAAPGVARAQDLETVFFTRAIADQGGIGETFTGEIRVKGTGITSATVTFPGEEDPRTLPLVPGNDRVLALAFADEEELDDGFPSGEYEFSLNGGAVEFTLGYAPTDVPAPDISSPQDESVVSPVGVSFLFSSCAVCSQPGDSTTATLTETGVPVVTEVIASTATSWIPMDGGPFVFDPSTVYAFSLVHAAVRSFNASAGTDAFTNEVSTSHSDTVDFSTGFAPPSGAFCIVVNDPGGVLHVPLEGCVVITDPASPIVDPSQSVPVAVTAGGMSVEYVFDALPTGRISGTAEADADGVGGLETLVPLRGQIRGRRNHLRQALVIQIKDAPADPTARLSIVATELTNTASGVRTTNLRTRGTWMGVKVSETTTTTVAVAVQTGWRLDFEFDSPDGASLEVSSAALRLIGAAAIPLEGTGRFDVERNLSHLVLKSSGIMRGIVVRVKDLVLDGGGDIDEGIVRYRAYGQRGRVELP